MLQNYLVLAQLCHAALPILHEALLAHHRVLHLDQVLDHVNRGRVGLVESPERVFAYLRLRVDVALDSESVPLLQALSLVVACSSEDAKVNAFIVGRSWESFTLVRESNEGVRFSFFSLKPFALVFVKSLVWFLAYFLISFALLLTRKPEIEPLLVASF